MKPMVRPAKITTPFPSVLETAKRLGVSKRDAAVLSEMAEREFAILTSRKSRSGRNSTTGEAIKLPARKVVKSLGAGAAKKATSSANR